MKAGDANKAAILATLEQMFGPDKVFKEYKFHAIRRWRFDYAIPEIKLAIEYHGHAGFVGKGSSGHSTIKGLTNDCEKMNSASAHGWKVLAFTALHFRHAERMRHNLTDLENTIINAKQL